MEGAGLGRGLEWFAVTWSADVAALFPRFRSLTNDMTVLPAEIRSFLDATRDQGSGLTILDFGGGSGELVGAACRAEDRHVILDPVRDPSTAESLHGRAFDALIFSHVLPFIADPLALFADLAAYSHPDTRSLAIVLDDTGTQAEICREAANSDPHFLHHFGHAQRLESLLDSAGIHFSSHTVETRTVARSRDDLLMVVAFYLDGVIDELVDRLASTIPPESTGDYVLTTHHRVFTWRSTESKFRQSAPLSV